MPPQQFPGTHCEISTVSLGAPQQSRVELVVRQHHFAAQRHKGAVRPSAYIFRCGWWRTVRSVRSSACFSQRSPGEALDKERKREEADIFLTSTTSSGPPVVVAANKVAHLLIC